MSDNKPPSPGPEPGGPRRRNGDFPVGKAWNLVIEFLGFMAVLGYGGWWLDERYGWNGRGLFIGLILALVAWIYRVLRQTWRMFK